MPEFKFENPFPALGPGARGEFLVDAMSWLESTRQVQLLGWQPGDPLATLDNEPTVVTTIEKHGVWFDSWLRGVIGTVRQELWGEWKAQLSLTDQQEYVRRAHAEIVEDVRRWGSD